MVVVESINFSRLQGALHATHRPIVSVRIIICIISLLSLYATVLYIIDLFIYLIRDLTFFPIDYLMQCMIFFFLFMFNFSHGP